MRGDFSAWNKDRGHNFRGTLHQQGRVLLDRDWNAQTEIVGEWQETAARDAFGAGVAAVPAADPLAFKVTQAQITGGTVRISLNKGRAWADGLLTELARDPEPPALPAGVDAIRTATYLGPPVQGSPLPADIPATGTGIRDAVILEAWLQELSPFQQPELLIEAALGGVDTTERVQTAFRLRLYRMAAGDTCASIASQLKDDFGAKGTLAVELNPVSAVDGDCPVVEEGGFTGFEHRLYRIEIAETDRPSPQAYFKWSHFNGGLVGTGDFDSATRKVTVHGNRNAILYSGLTSAYLEALDYDTSRGCWTVAYGAKATLGADGTLTLPDPIANPGSIFRGSIPPPPASGRRFFRLWNGIERVADFVPAKKALPDNLGIVMKFAAEGAGKYTPSDFWTFEVRAGGLGNPTVLVPNLPPQGIFYHRVPLAEIDWTSATVTAGIEDCRQVFQPLTKLKTCCTYRVGDGIHSHGDFAKIQDAVNALPAAGGEVCILPGVYRENVVLQPPHNKSITLKGCGRRTRLQAVTNRPVIHVTYGQGITIESLAVEAHADGIGIFLEGEERQALGLNADRYLTGITLSNLFVTATGQSAIQAQIAQTLSLVNSVVHITDSEATARPAVYLTGDDMLIERNEIRVLSRGAAAAGLGHELTNDPALFVAAQEASGGLQVGGGSERVRIVNNLIVSGIGNGITLGSIDVEDSGGLFVTTFMPFVPAGHIHDCCKPDDGFIDEDDKDDEGRKPVAGPPLHDILIKDNRIFNMGRNGIGVATFFGMGGDSGLMGLSGFAKAAAAGMISVSRLVIAGNRIERCVNNAPPEIPDKMTSLMGFGAIALGDTEDLIIRDNYLAGNGSSFLDPVCGIFILMGEGIEISRNHILDNGIRTNAEISPSSVNNGARGGIFIVHARPPGVDALPYSPGKAYFASGYPAAKIQENIVTVPFGRSLTLFGKGSMSIVGNQFTSFGIPPFSLMQLIGEAAGAGGGISPGAVLQLLSLLAGNVLIFNQGWAGYLSPEAASFAKIKNGSAGNPDTPGENVFFENGNVLFSNNQCHQSLFSSDTSYALSSIFIASLDDIGFLGNQCECDLDTDRLFVNALAFGMTLRVSDNRFRESIKRVAFSAATFGLHNITTDNEAVHCLLVLGIAYLDRHNLILAELGTVSGDVTKFTGERPCDDPKQAFAAFGEDL